MSKETFSSTIFEDKATGKYRWRVYYYDRTGTRRNKSGRTKTKAEAKRAVATKQSELLDGADFSRENVVLADYFEDYLARYKAGKASQVTKNRYRSFSKQLRAYWGDKPLKEITPDSWQDFINYFSEDHVKDTVQKLNGYAHGMVKVAMANGILLRDFAAHVTYPELKVAGDMARKRWLELDDLKNLKNYVYSMANYSAITTYMVATAIDAGLRYEEIVGLTWGSINAEANTLSIEQTWDYKNREEDADGEAPTKTPDGVRVIDVPSGLIALLLRLKTQQKLTYKKQNYADPHDLVFRPARHAIPTNEGANDQLREYESAVGIPEEHQVTFHGLRHSHVAFLAAQDGVDIYYISKRLGHKNVAVTLKYYHHLLKHVADEKAKAAVKALAEL